MKKVTVCKIFYGLMCFAVFLTNAFAEDPPSPQEVVTSVTNKWVQQELTQLDTYISDLYSAHPTYVPAILAVSFQDYIFSGKLSAATNKLHQIQELIDSDPENFEADFKDLLKELDAVLQSEINLHNRKGTSPETLQANADAQVVRNTWGTTLLPSINILFYAPATNTVAPP